MSRFLWIYAIAILFGVSIATYTTKHSPITPQAKTSQPAVQNHAMTPAPMTFARVTEAIESDRGGHYIASVELEGRTVPMLIDTGATFLSLTSEDAERLGIRPSPADFTLRMQTANGISSAARTWIPRVRVGMVEVHDVETIVMAKGASAMSLLGMSFLQRLNRFGISGNRLVLEQ